MGYFLPWFMDVEDVSVSFIKPNLYEDGFARVRVGTSYYLLSHFVFSQKSNSIAEVDSVMWTLIKANLRKKGKSLGEIVSVETNVHVPWRMS